MNRSMSRLMLRPVRWLAVAGVAAAVVVGGNALLINSQPQPVAVNVAAPGDQVVAVAHSTGQHDQIKPVANAPAQQDQAAPAGNTSAQRDQAISDAVTAYLRAEESPLADQISVEVVEQVDTYVRLQITPNNPDEADPAIAFAHEVDGTWQVLSLGTAFLPEDCAALGLPATLTCSE